MYLIETLLYELGEVPLLTLHMNRMESSSIYFCYPFSQKEFLTCLTEITSTLNKQKRYKLRILLDKEGIFQGESSLITEKHTSAVIGMNFFNISKGNIFLYHKTSKREYYEKAYQYAQQRKWDDTILYNENGEITETTRYNIWFMKDNIWYTPPQECGLLCGVYRKKMMEEQNVQEKKFYRADIYTHEIYLSNAVRGLIKAELHE